MSDPDLRHARIRITLTPPLTMVAQDADAAGISLAALLSADVHRGRYLALNAWRALDISHDTVKLHVRHILAKLNLSSRVEAAVFAVEARVTGMR